MKIEELKLRKEYSVGTAHPTCFERLNRAAYRELLIKNGFVIQSRQRYLFQGNPCSYKPEINFSGAPNEENSVLWFNCIIYLFYRL